MSITLNIPTPFRPYTDGASALELQAENVEQAVDTLATEHPALRQHLFTDEGALRTFVNLFLNGEDIRYLQGLATPLQAGDKLRIIPSIAGGR